VAAQAGRTLRNCTGKQVDRESRHARNAGIETSARPLSASSHETRRPPLNTGIGRLAASLSLLLCPSLAIHCTVTAAVLVTDPRVAVIVDVPAANPETTPL